MEGTVPGIYLNNNNNNSSNIITTITTNIIINNNRLISEWGEEGIVVAPHWIIPARGHNNDKHIDK